MMATGQADFDIVVTFPRSVHCGRSPRRDEKLGTRRCHEPVCQMILFCSTAQDDGLLLGDGFCQHGFSP